MVIQRTTCSWLKITSKLLALLAQYTLPREQLLIVHCIVDAYKISDKMITNIAAFMITNCSNLKPTHLWAWYGFHLKQRISTWTIVAEDSSANTHENI